MRCSLKNLDENSEGKIILKSIFLFKQLQYSVNKYRLLLFERHKLSPRSNIIIITKVMAVPRNKHSGNDTS